MAENLKVNAAAGKRERYEELLPQIKSLIEYENDITANLANVAAALKYGMEYFWVGFYLKKGNELVLGPFQGPVACTRIPFSKGVCGASYSQKETIIVDDVDAFPGHIACSSLSKSEIVVPVFKDGDVIAILDVDSETLASFDEIDKKYLEDLMDTLAKKM